MGCTGGDHRDPRQVLAAQRAVATAIEEFDQAIKLNPNFANAFKGRGLAKEKNGDKAGAATDMATANGINLNIGR